MSNEIETEIASGIIKIIKKLQDASATEETYSFALESIYESFADKMEDKGYGKEEIEHTWYEIEKECGLSWRSVV